MNGPSPTDRNWFIDLTPGEARLRCSFRRQGKRIEQFTVQLEIEHQGIWHPVTRYDNAHGFSHRDDLHPDGTQDKTVVNVGDANATFTYAIRDLRANWSSHRARFLRELKP